MRQTTEENPRHLRKPTQSLYMHLFICLPPIRSGEIIDYININLLHKFSSEQGRILSRRMNRLTLKQQLLMTIAIRQA
ncbi:hypothetical protein BDL97_06G033700 [Sphagnum fallax]|nr:hypothetical protein BDL97_06G033700 [Sphagnum fallax]